VFAVFLPFSILLLPSVLMFFAGMINPKHLPKEIIFHWYLLISFLLSVIFLVFYNFWFFLHGGYISF